MVNHSVTAGFVNDVEVKECVGPHVECTASMVMPCGSGIPRAVGLRDKVEVVKYRCAILG